MVGILKKKALQLILHLINITLLLQFKEKMTVLFAAFKLTYNYLICVPSLNHLNKKKISIK